MNAKRKAGLSKTNERKLAKAKALLAEVAQDLDRLDSKKIFDVVIAVSKAFDATRHAVETFTAANDHREYGVTFYQGDDVVESWGTSGANLTFDEVKARADRARIEGTRYASAGELQAARLVVTELTMNIRRVLLDERRGEKVYAA